MANQPPPARPWFRLASLALRESPQPPPPAPVTAPPPAPTQTVQPPRGTPIRQLVRPSAVLPSQPQPPPVQPQPETTQPAPPPPQPQPLSQPTTPPRPPSPPPQLSVTPPRGESTELETPSVEPPKQVKQPSSPLPTLRPIKTSPSPPLRSPKVNKSPSPSPRYDSGDRTLKPSPEPELKTIPEAQPKTTTNNDKGEPYKNARNGEQKLGTSQADTRGPPPSLKRDTKKKDEDDLRLITMAGDNVGAYMDLGPSYGISGRKQQQSNGKQGQVSNSAANDGKSSDKDGTRAAAAKAKAKAKPMTSLVNSNVQSVNNSIVYSSSCTQRSPGVHIILTSHRDPKSKAHSPPQ